MRKFACFAFAMIVSGNSSSVAVADDCLSGYLQGKIIKAIVECKTTSDLHQLRSREIFKNEITEAIYRLRIYELQPTPSAEEALIHTVPQSDVTLSVLYQLTFPGEGPPTRPQLFEEYLHTVYRIVRKSRARYQILLHLAVLARGGDLGEAVGEYVTRLYDADPIGVSQILTDMPEREEHLVCGEDAVPCPRKPTRRAKRVRRGPPEQQQ